MGIKTQSISVIDRIIPSSRREMWYRSAQRFLSRPMSVAGLVLVTGVTLLAVFAPELAPYPEHAGKYTDFASARQPPSLEHPFGTDRIGRDVLSRVIFGYRLSLQLAATVIVVAVPVGVTLGLVAGYYGGKIESVIMMVTDIFLALPPLVMALAIISVLEPTLTNAMIALISIWWTWHARIVKGLAASERNKEYVRAAEILGASTPHILFREILPNIISPILVKVTLDAGILILTGASLSFIGIGVQPPRPGLGTMVANGSNLLPSIWWVSIFSGFAILVAVLGFNMLGDGLRDLFDVEVQQ
jgi:peptide/nickel transport system permease protein